MSAAIAKNIETVFNTFQQGRKLSEQELSLEELIAELNHFDPRYRSVAFEGASMGVAIANSLSTWKVFASATEKHATQVHIGLGWAVAEQQVDPADILPEIEREYRIKVLEGFGYWHSLFNKRNTIRTQQTPEVITPELQTGFDQGVGRAIWYISKGDVAKLQSVTGHFSEERKPHLWFGIGVASTYVGGCSDDLVSDLNAVAGEFSSKFQEGILSAKGTMETAEALSDE